MGKMVRNLLGQAMHPSLRDLTRMTKLISRYITHPWEKTASGSPLLTRWSSTRTGGHTSSSLILRTGIREEGVVAEERELRLTVLGNGGRYHGEMDKESHENSIYR